jgi:hypothetical protein
MTKIKDYREQREFRYKIRLLPNWETVINYVSNKDILYKKYTRLDDCIIDGFKWDETPEGHKYWQRVCASIKFMPAKKCCKIYMRTSDVSQHYRCSKCKKTIK